MDENNKDFLEGKFPNEEIIPLVEKNETKPNEKVDSLVSVVSSSVETVAQDLTESQTVVQCNEKSNRFQNK